MQPGFKIDEKEYEFPTRFRMCDPALVEELTGLEFSQFAARIDRVNASIQEGERAGDAVVMSGMIGVAIWQANPRWARGRVVEMVQQIDMDSFEAIEGADDTGEATPDEEPETPSSDSSAVSTITPVVALAGDHV